MRVAAFRVGSFKGKAVMVLIVLSLFIFFFCRGVQNFHDQIVSVELSSQAYQARMTFHDHKFLNLVNAQVSEANIVTGSAMITGKYKLVLNGKKKAETYVFDNPGQLYELKGGTLLLLKDGGKCLESAVKQIESLNPYGEFLPWSEARQIFDRYDKARVRDFETGLSFMVQRRAGSQHADVQPLTAEDSAIMKKIYGGRWSWKRRAIIVEVKGHRIAASMNGMPHGAGAIANNDFDGHFCIHFRDSKTHANEDNLAHQVMVWRAAGKVEEMLAGAEPEMVMRVMLTAMEQSDPNLAAMMFETTPKAGRNETVEKLRKIKWLAVSKISEPKIEGKTARFNLIVSYGLSDGTQVRNRKVGFVLNKNRGKLPWAINCQVLERLDGDKVKTGTTTTEPDDSVYRDWYVDMEG